MDVDRMGGIRSPVKYWLLDLERAKMIFKSFHGNVPSYTSYICTRISETTSSELRNSDTNPRTRMLRTSAGKGVFHSGEQVYEMEAPILHTVGSLHTLPGESNIVT